MTESKNKIAYGLIALAFLLIPIEVYVFAPFTIPWASLILIAFGMVLTKVSSDSLKWMKNYIVRSIRSIRRGTLLAYVIVWSVVEAIVLLIPAMPHLEFFFLMIVGIVMTWIGVYVMNIAFPAKKTEAI